MKHFKSRAEAGRQLAAVLPALAPDQTVVLALPRGGVPVAAEICSSHGLPMDLIFMRKIGAPDQPELALGAITNGSQPKIITNTRIARAFGFGVSEVEALGRALLPEIARRRALYLGDRDPMSLSGKTVVVVDDGIATGATMKAALASLKDSGARRIILALPVAPAAELAEFEELADQVICLHIPHPFYGVGAHYAAFPQVTDDEVIAILKDHAPTAA